MYSWVFMPVLLNLCMWRLTSFFVAVTKLTTKKVWGPSGAGEVVCKWLHVPLHWLHKVFLGLLMLKQSTVQSATLFFRLYSTCTSLWWSSILLLLGMILNIFKVLELKQRRIQQVVWSVLVGRENALLILILTDTCNQEVRRETSVGRS